MINPLGVQRAGAGCPTRNDGGRGIAMKKIHLFHSRVIAGDYPDTLEMEQINGQPPIKFHAAGIGKYPYECIAKGTFAYAMIYHSEHGSWTSLISSLYPENAKAVKIALRDEKRLGGYMPNGF